MFTPDYQTPAEAQFACNMDPNVAPDKENRGQRSPAPLSPQRNKRPRSGYDPTLSQDSQLGSQPMGSQPTQGWNTQPRPVAGPRGPGGSRREQRRRRRGHLPHPGTSQTPGRSRPSRRTISSVSAQPFLGDEEQPAEVPAHRRSGNSATPAALATMSRLRADSWIWASWAAADFAECQVHLQAGRRHVRGEAHRTQASERARETGGAARGAGHGGPRRWARVRAHRALFRRVDGVRPPLRPARTLRRHPRRSVHRVHAKGRARPRARRAKRGADSQSNASMPDALDDPEDADAFVFGEREILVVVARPWPASALRAREASRISTSNPTTFSPSAKRTNSQTGAAPRPWTAWGT